MSAECDRLASARDELIAERNELLARATQLQHEIETFNRAIFIVSGQTVRIDMNELPTRHKPRRSYADTIKSGTVIDIVLKILQENPAGMTGSEIYKATQSRVKNRSSVASALSRLKLDSLVTHDRHIWKYCGDTTDAES